MTLGFLQDIIDIIRRKVPYLPAVAATYFVYKKIHDYETLALGSSHICLYIPDNNGINLGMASQDLYYSYEMYKLLNNENKNIKNIILSFSVFTPGHCLIKTRENKLTVLYKTLFGIDYQYPEVAKQKYLHIFEKLYKSKIEKYVKNTTADISYRGGMPENYFVTSNIDATETQKVALKHYKNNQRSESQMYLLERLIQDTKERKQNLYLIISPVPDVYRNCLPDKQTLFKELYSKIHNHAHVKLVDMYDSELFRKEDFYDGHHVNLIGAKKATQIINEALKGENK